MRLKHKVVVLAVRAVLLLLLFSGSLFGMFAFAVGVAQERGKLPFAGWADTDLGC